MEHSEPSPDDKSEQFLKTMELSHLAAKIIYLAQVNGIISETSQGDLIEIMDIITIDLVNDDRTDLIQLGNLVMQFNELRENLPNRNIRLVVSRGNNGMMYIKFTN